MFNNLQLKSLVLTSSLCCAALSQAVVDSALDSDNNANPSLGVPAAPSSTAYNPFQTNISYLSGSVQRLRNGQIQVVQEGQPIVRGDTYVTAANGRMHVILGQDTVLEIGGETTLDIPQFQSMPEVEGGLKGWFKLQQGAMRIYTLPVTVVRERRFQINLADDTPQIYAQFGRLNVDITAQVQADGEQRFLGHSVCTHSGNNTIYQRLNNDDKLLETLRDANQCYRTDTPIGVSPTYSLQQQDTRARYAASSTLVAEPLAASQQVALRERVLKVRQRLVAEQAQTTATLPQNQNMLLGSTFRLPKALPDVLLGETPPAIGPTRAAGALETSALANGPVALQTRPKNPIAIQPLILNQSKVTNRANNQQFPTPSSAVAQPSIKRSTIVPAVTNSTASDIEAMLAGLSTATPPKTVGLPQNTRRSAQKSVTKLAASAVKSTADLTKISPKIPIKPLHKANVPKPRYNQAGDWRVYLLSIRDLQKAAQITAKLRKAGFDADIEAHVQAATQQRFARVFIRNLPNAAAAKTTGKDFLGVYGIRDFWIRKKS